MAKPTASATMRVPLGCGTPQLRQPPTTSSGAGGWGSEALVADRLVAEPSEGRRDHLRHAVGGDLDFPGLSERVLRWFERRMVLHAEEHEVVQGRNAAHGPTPDVVGFAADGADVAAGHDAAAVAEFECGAEVGADEAVFASEVEDGGVAVHDGGEDSGVAAESA